MNSETDLYSILELNKNSSLVEIKHNFKKLSLKYHHDKYKHKDANEKFNQIRIAYEILSDPVKKQKYDTMVITKKCMIYFILQNITKRLQQQRKQPKRLVNVQKIRVN